MKKILENMPFGTEDDIEQQCAEFLARKFEKKGKGNNWIEHDLLSRNISKKIIKKALKTLDNEPNRALLVAEEKNSQLLDKPAEERYARVVNFLGGRGFAKNVCFEAAKLVVEVKLYQKF